MKTPRRLILAPLTLLLLAGCSSAATPSTTTPAPASAPASSASAPSTAASSSTPSSSSTGASKSYTMSDVAKHDTSEDCWAAVDGGVYDLTSWISRHPGGPDKIEPLCGTDATQAFRTKHDGAEKPNDQLASFKIGDLSD